MTTLSLTKNVKLVSKIIQKGSCNIFIDTILGPWYCTKKGMDILFLRQNQTLADMFAIQFCSD